MISADDARNILLREVDAELKVIYDLVRRAAKSEDHIYVRSDFWSNERNTAKWLLAAQRLTDQKFQVVYDVHLKGVKISW